MMIFNDERVEVSFLAVAPGVGDWWRFTTNVQGWIFVKKIWNCLSLILGYFETVCDGGPGYLKTVCRSFKIFLAMQVNDTTSNTRFQYTKRCVWTWGKFCIKKKHSNCCNIVCLSNEKNYETVNLGFETVCGGSSPGR